MSLRRLLLCGTTLFASGLLVGFLCTGLTYQEVQGDRFKPENLSPRDQLFAELNQEAKEMNRFGKVIQLVAKVITPSVVHIESKKLESSGPRSRYVEEAGSGVIVEFESQPNRYFVLTNSHVIHNAPLNRISLQLADGRSFNPTRVWEDPDTDVAVMEVSGVSVEAAKLGDSSQVHIGQFALAVGSPFGLDHSITLGIISAKGRRDLELGDDAVKYQDFMQTDAAINPGNSGGPLVNLQGEVIGINAAIASNSGGNEGIGFSIPSNMVVKIAQQLISNGVVRRAFLGVELDPKFGPAAAAQMGLPTPRGARISGIRENTPASVAQLKIGDVVLEFGGIAVDDDTHLINLVGLTEVGKDVPVTIWRDQKRYRVSVRVGDRTKLVRQN